MIWSRPLLASSIVLLGPACFSPPPLDDAGTAMTLATDGANTDSATDSATDASTTEDPAATSSGDGSSSGPGADSTTSVTTGEDDTSTGEPSVCGDGEIGGSEACDDANTDDGDGCSGTCEEELGFQCVGQPSVCESSCGDGVVASDESCDDGNPDDDDGCTACTVDPGFQCLGAMPSVCDSVCGDGLVVGSETCDDGDVVDGNGCASDCSVELYSRCQGEGPGSCAPIRILYAPADTDDSTFRSTMSMLTGGPADYTDAGSTTPTLASLQADYDCVFTHPNFTYQDSPGFGTTLANYVDGGGNVVLGIATAYSPPTGLSGSPIMLAAYSPATSAANVNFGTMSYFGDGTSPIHTGVMAYGGNIYDTGVVLQGMGIQDSTYDNGEIAVAYRPDFKVVYVNGTGNSSFNATGDWPLLVANACAVGFL